MIMNGEAVSAAGGWLNILAEDWSYIDESHQDREVVRKRQKEFRKEIELDQRRAVFAKYKDNLGFNRYRFVGVFQRVGMSPEDSNFIRYNRIENKIDIV